MDKILNLVEKVNKYTHLEYTLKQYCTFLFLVLIALFLIFIFFEKTWSMIKDNILKWDEVTFLKLTLCMLIPLASLISLNFNFLSDKHLNDWLHFFSLFFVIPVFPYIFMCIHHCFYLIIKKIILSLKK